MNTIATRRLTAATMASAAILAGAGFTALGSIFNYPKVLQSPAAGILAAYRQHGLAISAWFGVLVLSAALLGPAGVGLGRLAGGRTGTWIAGTGIAAALVQVTGLSRWVLFVPGLSDDAVVPAHTQDAYHRFELLHLAGHRHRRDPRIRPDRRVHRSRGPGRHPDERTELDGLPRICGGGAHRHRRGRSARARHRAPHELGRLCRLLRMASSHGHRAVAQQAARRRHRRADAYDPSPESRALLTSAGRRRDTGAR